MITSWLETLNDLRPHLFFDEFRESQSLNLF